MIEFKTNLVCDCCGEPVAKEAIKQMPIEYGDGPDAVVLYADAPVISCPECGIEYTDSRAEFIRHDAICTHLGLLTSSQLREMRQRLGWSVQRMSNETGLGTASISRWENAQIIQSKANDKLMRFFYERHQIFVEAVAQPAPAIMQSRFRHIKLDSFLLARAETFSLCIQ